MEDCAGLAVYLYEPREEIYEDIKRKLHSTAYEVALQRKQLYVFSDKKDINITCMNSEGGWVLHQGSETATIPVAYFFDPELIGSLPCQDYLFKLEDVTNISLTCGFVIQQSGQKEISIDLKVPLGKRFMQTYRYSSSGYFTFQNDLDSVFEEIVLSDRDYKHEEPRAYMERLCNDLSEYVAAKYKLVSWNLGIKEPVIQRTENDYRAEGCREVCYQLFLEWLKTVSCNEPESKRMLVHQLKEAVYKSGCKFISFLVNEVEERRVRTQSRIETTV